MLSVLKLKMIEVNSVKTISGKLLAKDSVNINITFPVWISTKLGGIVVLPYCIYIQFYISFSLDSILLLDNFYNIFNCSLSFYCAYYKTIQQAKQLL